MSTDNGDGEDDNGEQSEEVKKEMAWATKTFEDDSKQLEKLTGKRDTPSNVEIDSEIYSALPKSDNLSTFKFGAFIAQAKNPSRRGGELGSPSTKVRERMLPQVCPHFSFSFSASLSLKSEGLLFS